MQENKREDPVRAFLDSVREARFNEARCRRKLQEMDAQCRSITAQMTGMPGGGSADPHKDGAWAALADQAALLRELYDQAALLRELYDQAVRRETDVERFISRLEKDTHRILLRLKYVDLLTWNCVQERMQENGIYYSERQIYRIHGEALQEARKLWARLHPEEGEKSA